MLAKSYKKTVDWLSYCEYFKNIKVFNSTSFNTLFITNM